METGETHIHSFVVKIWIENPESPIGRQRLHGYIVHVPDGKRRYLRRLDDIVEYILEYMPPSEPRNGASAA